MGGTEKILGSLASDARIHMLYTYPIYVLGVVGGELERMGDQFGNVPHLGRLRHRTALVSVP